MLNPADGKPVPLEAFTPALPHGSAGAGGVAAAGDHHPRRGAQGLLPVPAHAAHPRKVPGGGAGYSCHDLLQERKRDAHRQPQAEHGHPPGLLQPEGRREEACDRNRGGTVGERARICRGAFQPGDQRVHGPRFLRAEAVPQDHDGELRRQGACQPLQGDADREEAARRTRGTCPAPWASPSARRWKSRPPPRARSSTPWARCSTTCSCTRP